MLLYNLLVKLVEQKTTSLTDVTDFCKVFDIDKDTGLSRCLKLLLFSSELRQAVYSLTEQTPACDLWKSVSYKATAVMREISDENVIVSTLIKLSQQVDLYLYEVHEFVLANLLTISQRHDQLREKLEKELTILQFLKNYNRISPPAEYEYDMCFEQNDCETMPAVTNTRLPFLQLLHRDPWQILDKELSPSTVDSWMAVAPLLNVSVVRLRTATVKNMVHDWLCLHQHYYIPAAHSQWCPYPADHVFLKKLEMLLSSIPDMEAAYDSSEWMLECIRPGPMKVHLAKLSLNIARQWHDSNASCTKASRACQDASCAYQKLAVEQVLRRYNLISTKSCSLIKNPSEISGIS